MLRYLFLKRGYLEDGCQSTVLKIFVGKLKKDPGGLRSPVPELLALSFGGLDPQR